MEKFTQLTGVAAPLDMINVDTDMVIPKQYLTTVERTGLGRGLFFEMRFDADGNENPDFVLNQAPYRDAKILIAGENFGCGSSREHAPWALLDFGIRCVIAPSFADIFHTNCIKNGILPVRLPKKTVTAMMAAAGQGANATFTVDLETQTVTGPDGIEAAFEIGAFERHCLLNGLDDIALTLENAAGIDAFEERQKASLPWLYG